MLLSCRALLLLFASPPDRASASVEVEAAAALIPKATFIPSVGPRAFSSLRLLIQLARELNLVEVAQLVRMLMLTRADMNFPYSCSLVD